MFHFFRTRNESFVKRSLVDANKKALLAALSVEKEEALLAALDNLVEKKEELESELDFPVDNLIEEVDEDLLF